MHRMKIATVETMVLFDIHMSAVSSIKRDAHQRMTKKKHTHRQPQTHSAREKQATAQ